MALIQQGMSINCRTTEEVEVFQKIATVEGHRWRSGSRLIDACNAPISFQVGYDDSEFPNDISYCHDMHFTGEDECEGTMTVIEASQLFRNHLISRRAKHGTN